jgi:peroxiredoxin Q/BCP
MAKEVITAGSVAPTFKLPASDGTMVDLKEVAARGPVVLFFYPKADTPGCTKEACGFRDAIADYRKIDVPVYGISPDPIKAVKKFAEKYKLNFPLLADEDHSIAEAYGVWGEKKFMGRKYMGVARTTFIIGKGGKVLHVFENVKPEGHEGEVMGWLRENIG